MALRVVDHYPDINETGVPRNIHVKAQFDKAITPQSVEYTHFSVHEKSAYTTVVGDLGVEYNSNGEAILAVFQPDSNLTANTDYVVYVFGRPNSIVAGDGDQLEDTYSFEFRTGTSLLDGQMPAGIPSGNLSVSGVLASGVTTSGTVSGLYLRVLSTDPQHQEPNVATQLSGIYITFNMDIATPALEAAGLVTIEESCVLY